MATHPQTTLQGLGATEPDDPVAVTQQQAVAGGAQNTATPVTAPPGLGATQPGPADIYQRDHNDNVGNIAADLMGKDSPLMRRAAAQGRQFANTRGLLNSSMAAQASQSAMLDHIVPMASQTADQGFRKNVQGRENAFKGEQAAQDRSLKADLFERDATLRREKMGLDERLAEADRALRLTISDKQVSSNDRRGAESLLANAFRDYEEAQRSILSNTELKATERNKLLRNAKNMLTAKINYTSELYQTDFDWPENPFVSADKPDTNKKDDDGASRPPATSGSGSEK